MNRTKIPYCDYTWNPVTGCTRGCKYCYAEKLTRRFWKAWGCEPPPNHFKPRFHPKRLNEPLKVKKPSTIFVCDMGDLFDPEVKFEWQQAICMKMAEANWHTFLVLTKRPDRLLALFKAVKHPVPENIFWGTTCMNQKDTDERIPKLQKLIEYGVTNLWLSLEPLIENIVLPQDFLNASLPGATRWVVAGGMTGPCAAWTPEVDVSAFRSLRDQCKAAGVPFFFKQMPKRAPIPEDLMIREKP